jgi:methylglutaconyl-CoA hydratase
MDRFSGGKEMTANKEITSRREGDVLCLTLNRPSRGNSLNEPLLEQLVKAITDAGADKTLKALVLNGQGDRFFCTGADLDDLGNPAHNPDKIFSLFNQTLEALSKLDLLTASFVNGDCVGGGLGIALSTDFVLAAGHARFGTPEITRGLFPFVISGALLNKLGEQRAKALCFGGRLWTASEALQYGVVSELVGTLQFSGRSHELVKLWNQVAEVNLKRGKEALDPRRRPLSSQLVDYLRDAVKLFRNQP